MPPDRLALMHRDNAAARDLTVRAYQVRASSINEQARTVDAVLATEDPVHVFDMRSWSVIREILVMPTGNLPAQVPLLDSHQRSSIQQQLGSTRNLRVEGPQLVGTRHLSSVAAAADAFTKIREGHLTDGSIGYQVRGYTDIEPGQSVDLAGRTFRNTGPDVLRVTYDWALYEDSLCPIGADPGAKIREAPPTTSAGTPAKEPAVKYLRAILALIATHRHLEAEILGRAEQIDSDAKLDELRTWAAAQAKPGTKPAAADGDETARAQELAAGRRAQIHLDLLGLARSHGVELTADDLKPVETREAGLTLILERAAAKGERRPDGDVGASIEVGRSAVDKRREAAVDGLLAGSFGTRDLALLGNDHGKDLGMRRYGLRQILEELVPEARHWNNEQRAAFYCRQSLFDLGLRDANQSAANFSVILGNYANKAVLIGYRSQKITHTRWTSERLVDDFKTVYGAAVASGLLKEQVAKGAPAEEINLLEKSYNGALGLFMRSATWAYQDKRNDDLGQFADMLRNVGVIGATTEDYQVYKLLLGLTWTNHITTAAAFYDDTNKRLVHDGWGKTQADFENKVYTANGESVPVSPLLGYILCPAKRRQAALAVTGNVGLTGAQAPGVDGMPEVITSPWLANASLSGYSADDYYLIASNMDTVKVLRDRANPGPVVRQIAAGNNADENYLIMHAFRPVLASQDGMQKGDWA